MPSGVTRSSTCTSRTRSSTRACPASRAGDAYSRRQFGRLVDAAGRAGIGVVPIVNLLGHTQYLIKVPGLRDLNELRAPDGSPLEQGQVCPLHPRMLEVAELLLRDMAPFCTAGKVHVGLDESFSLGRHPLSRAEVAEVGLAAHFGRHVGRLHALCGGLRLRMGLWADMLALLPAAIGHLPPGSSPTTGTTTPSRASRAWSCATSRSTTWPPRSGRAGSSTGAAR